MTISSSESVVQALFHFNNSLQDTSTARKTGQPHSGASPSYSTTSKFGSHALDGYAMGVYGGLYTPVNFNWHVNGFEYTMDAWVRPRSFTDAGSGGWRCVFSLNSSGFGSQFHIRVLCPSGFLNWGYIDNTGSSVSISSSVLLALNTYQHIQYERTADNMYGIWVDGVLQVANSNRPFPSLSASSTINFNVAGGGTSGSYPLDAQIDEARCLNISERLAANYVEDQVGPWPDSVGAGDADFASVSLLLHGQGTNGGTTITDSSSNALTPTVVGSVVTNNVAVKFGTTSLRFNGSSALKYASSTLFDLLAGDFTIDCVFRCESNGNVQHIFQFGADANNRVYLVSQAGAQLSFGFFRAGVQSNYAIGTSFIPTANIWYQVRLIKKGSRIILFLNGRIINCAANVTFPSAGNMEFHVGHQAFAALSSDYMIGHIQELRVTKGVSRSNPDFTPPAAPYSDVAKYAEGVSNTPFIRSKSTGMALSLNKKKLTLPLNLKDQYDGGNGKIEGTVKEYHSPTNDPVRRRVWLVRERDGRIIRETWSDPITGYYGFFYIDRAEKYTVLSHDYEHDFQAQANDNITPDLMP